MHPNTKSPCGMQEQCQCQTGGSSAQQLECNCSATKFWKLLTTLAARQWRVRPPLSLKSTCTLRQGRPLFLAGGTLGCGLYLVLLVHHTSWVPGPYLEVPEPPPRNMGFIRGCWKRAQSLYQDVGSYSKQGRESSAGNVSAMRASSQQCKGRVVVGKKKTTGQVRRVCADSALTKWLGLSGGQQRGRRRFDVFLPVWQLR